MRNSAYCRSNSKVSIESRGCSRFRLTTGYDFWGVYLYWLGLAADEDFPLTVHARMDGDHLLQRTGLNECPIGDIGNWYWETQRQMIKNPNTGGG
ncbi:hypothetical protein TNCV_2223331 [Trichonephila clavipes]|nr:hypothetical protein TNCV_2223331 [Trichonephila clavipes]